MSRPVAGILCGAMVLAVVAMFMPFLPTAAGTMGHDYGFNLPNLLVGYYWFLHNGVTQLPWFSPAQCGGFPYFADPSVAYISLPQMLVVLVSPLRAVQLTFVLFALIGLCGAYLLMRRGFRSSRAAAVLAAGLFVFNGFYVYRVLIGHLPYHGFALAPLTILLLLPGGGARIALLSRLGSVSAAALCFAYMFQVGMIHVIPPLLLATGILLLVHALCFGWRWEPWLRFGAAGLLSLTLCAGKLVAELALLANFPRNLYPLPGVPGIGTLLSLVGQALFISAPEDATAHLANAQWPQERNEWEYSVSIVPALLLAVAAVAAIARWPRHARPTGAQVLIIAAILALLACPLLLNWYQPAWNGILKSLPYFGSASSLLRFFCAYIPVVIVLACLALDRLPWPAGSGARLRSAVVVFCLGVIVAQNALTERDYYAGQSYQVQPIEAAYARARATGEVPPIEAIVDTGRLTERANDAMMAGGSQLDCYQPLLGYRREKFPVAPLRLGRVDQRIDGVLNLKNPACYLFSAENQCRPGDHFTVARAADAAAFLAYRPFPFVQPLRQQLATWISLLAGIAMVVVLLLWGGVAVRRRLEHPRHDYF
ncbi:MAG: hypothetical protein AB1586_29160 [Pseudomonadota bacterium]|jgi:hypothetical protein